MNLNIFKNLKLPEETWGKIHLALYLSLMIIDIPSGFFTLLSYLAFKQIGSEILLAIRAPDFFVKSNRDTDNFFRWLGFYI